MRETQGKVEASKDTVKELNKQLEPVEVIMTLDLFLDMYVCFLWSYPYCWCAASQGCS